MPKSTKHTIEFWKNMAVARFKGRCLSKKAGKTTDPLRWECSAGHVFTATPANVQDGHWCPKCGRKAASETRRKNSVSRVAEIIKKKKGRLLTPRAFISRMSTRISISCRKGHTWETKPSIIRSGSWCPICAIETRARNRIVPVKIIEKIVTAKGGKILGTIRGTGMRGEYLVQCSSPAHEPWSVRGWALKKNWCPQCNRPGRTPGMKSAKLI
jgi:hypothetical protein